MHTSILFGRKHGADEPLLLIAGPDNPTKINALYKEAVTEAAREPRAGIAEIQLWSSHGGCVKRKLFAPPKGAQPIPTAQPASQDVATSCEAPGGASSVEDDEEGPTLGDPGDKKRKGK